MLILGTMICNAQSYVYEPNSINSFGLPNPEAPSELLDWQELIGTCKCKSVKRIDAQIWADTVEMLWTWKYIMNGLAVQDETLKSDGIHSGSIRQYNPDSSKWYVHFYTTAAATPTLSAWHGNRQDDQIKLYKDQLAPNGMPGFYRILFTNINNDGFNWSGAWVSKNEAIVYPTWYIYCKKTDS